MNYKKALGALALLLVPTLALAHPGHGDNGLIAGISHPLGGLDHLLAMLAVGLWAAQQKGAARWALPCAFVGTMLIGGVLGFEGLNLPALESGNAASVLQWPWPCVHHWHWRSRRLRCSHCFMAWRMVLSCQRCPAHGLMRQVS